MPVCFSNGYKNNQNSCAATSFVCFTGRIKSEHSIFFVFLDTSRVNLFAVENIFGSLSMYILN